MIKKTFSFVNLILGLFTIAVWGLIWTLSTKAGLIIDGLVIGGTVYYVLPWFEKKYVSVWENIRPMKPNVRRNTKGDSDAN